MADLNGFTQNCLQLLDTEEEMCKTTELSIKVLFYGIFATICAFLFLESILILGRFFQRKFKKRRESYLRYSRLMDQMRIEIDNAPLLEMQDLQHNQLATDQTEDPNPNISVDLNDPKSD